MSTVSQRYIVQPGQSVSGVITVPGDKSISHRAVMLGSIADGETRVHGFLESEDCLATLAACKAMGVEVAASADGSLVIRGAGRDGLHAAAGALDLGNSGTGLRLLMGLLAGQSFDSVLTGDASLRRRPMERVAAPLRAMGARIATEQGGAPVRISGGARLHGIDYRLPVASAQIKSALLLAALGADGRTTLESPGPSRDHTERMLRAMGAAVETDEARHRVSLNGPCRLTGGRIDVPGDLSSAAFFIVAGCIGARDSIEIRNVGVNPTRTGILDALAAMGARIELRNQRLQAAEPVADILVHRSALKGIVIPPELVPLAIDELPVLFVAAAFADGQTTVTAAEELRHKESDRIHVMAQALSAVGIGVRERPDGMTIDGGTVSGGTIDTAGDHRIAMAFAVAALGSTGPITIIDTAPVSTSFPGFVGTAASAGLELAVAGSESA